MDLTNQGDGCAFPLSERFHGEAEVQRRGLGTFQGNEPDGASSGADPEGSGGCIDSGVR